MINLKSGCLVGSWRVRVWVCVRSSDRLFLKPAEPLWNIDWAWLWCRTVKAPLMWANMWTRSDLEGFSLSSCSECTPAPWADVHDNASVCPFLVLSKESNGKVYSLSILFCFLVCFIVGVPGFKDYRRMFPGCSLLKVTLCLFLNRNLKKQILFCLMCLWRYMSKFQLLKIETPVAKKLKPHKCPDLLIAFVQSHFSVIVVEQQRVFGPIISQLILINLVVALAWKTVQHVGFRRELPISSSLSLSFVNQTKATEFLYLMNSHRHQNMASFLWNHRVQSWCEPPSDL